MDNVLTDINHTTVEALGFKFVGQINCGMFNSDVFKLNNIKIRIDDYVGDPEVLVDDQQVFVENIEALKQLIKEKKAAN